MKEEGGKERVKGERKRQESGKKGMPQNQKESIDEERQRKGSR